MSSYPAAYPAAGSASAGADQRFTYKGGGGYQASGADFDGTNDWMTRGSDLTGAVDGKKFTVVLWYRIDGGDDATTTGFFITASRFKLEKHSSNNWRLFGRNSSASTILTAVGEDNAVVASATWGCLMASGDLATPGSGRMYRNDISDYSETAFVDDTLDYTVGDVGIGGQIDGTAKFNGCLAEIYVNLVTNIDFDVEANRRRFISPAGKPVSLGADGSGPTGTAPIGYWKNPFDSFETNSGTGGNMSVTGELAACSTSPSD